MEITIGALIFCEANIMYQNILTFYDSRFKIMMYVSLAKKALTLSGCKPLKNYCQIFSGTPAWNFCFCLTYSKEILEFVLEEGT